MAVITPNPKTSGGARWNYLAAWGYALEAGTGRSGQAEGPGEGKPGGSGSSEGARVRQRAFKRVPVLDSGARGSTNTFVQREIGDVLLAWENEAFLAVKELGPDKFEIVVPSSASWPSRRWRWSTRSPRSTARARGRRSLPEYLYSPEASSLPPSTTTGP